MSRGVLPARATACGWMLSEQEARGVVSGLKDGMHAAGTQWPMSTELQRAGPSFGAGHVPMVTCLYSRERDPYMLIIQRTRIKGLIGLGTKIK